MTTRHAVRITLTSQLKGCPNGHRVGDTWLVTRKTPPGMCLSAFHSIQPVLMTLRFGGDFPWARGGAVSVCCPDPEVVNTFRLERVEVRDEGEE